MDDNVYSGIVHVKCDTVFRLCSQRHDHRGVGGIVTIGRLEVGVVEREGGRFLG